MKADSTVDDTKTLLLLCNLHESLEWLSSQISSMTHWRRYYKKMKEIALKLKNAVLKKKELEMQNSSCAMFGTSSSRKQPCEAEELIGSTGEAHCRRSLRDHLR